MKTIPKQIEMFDDGKDHKLIPIRSFDNIKLMDGGYRIPEYEFEQEYQQEYGYKETSVKCICGANIIIQFIPSDTLPYLMKERIDYTDSVPKYYYSQFTCPFCCKPFQIPNAKRIVSIKSKSYEVNE